MIGQGTPEAAPMVWTTKGPGLAGVVCARAMMPGASEAEGPRLDPRLEADPSVDVEIALLLDGQAVHLAVCFAPRRWPDVHVRAAEAIGATPAEALDGLRRASPLPDLLANLQAWRMPDVLASIETAWTSHAGGQRRALMEAAHG